MSEFRESGLLFNMMTNDEDILAVARWAVLTFGEEALAVIRRRAAETLLEDEREATSLWRQVADAANHYLGTARVH